jgi:hypothetical protein
MAMQRNMTTKEEAVRKYLNGIVGFTASMLEMY